MSPKDYLDQLSKLDFKIKRLKKEIEALEERRISLSGMDYGKDPVQTSHDGQGFTKMSDRYLDKVKDLELACDVYSAMYERIQSEILQVSRLEYQELLSYKYVDGLSLQQVAATMDYTYDYARHMHGFALEAFRAEVMEKKAPPTTGKPSPTPSPQ